MARLLVVEDDVNSARMLARLLTRLGHQVDVVHNGEEVTRLPAEQRLAANRHQIGRARLRAGAAH